MAGKGEPKTGGRQKGTPNKTTTAIKAAITDALGEYLRPSGEPKTFLADLKAIKNPAERARTAAAFVGYVIPKQQALTVEERTEVETAALTEWLETAPEEAVNAIAAKVLELQEANRAKEAGK